MVIEIRGAHFVNKGAELMLLSVIEEVSKRVPGVKFVIEPQKKIPYEKRIKKNIYAIPRLKKFGLNFSNIFNLFPKKYRELLGIYTEDEIDAVIDISGFAYGDYWGVQMLKNNITNHLKKWKNKNIKLLLLPQAYGPFEKREMKKEFEKVIDYSEFISARDKISYDYVDEINRTQKKIYLFPDFTTTLKGTKVPSFYDDFIFIIPNGKMLSNAAYINYLQSLSYYLLKSDENFAFLIHEGEGDYNIAKNVCSKLNHNIDIIYNKDSLEIKSLIKQSKLIITSRFHGLINGLSQGIPSLSTSWSHKYEMLLKDYNFEYGLIQNLENFEITKEKIEYILNNYKSIQYNILKFSEIHNSEVDKMWDKVIDILNNN